ncbi:protein of unknown function [Paraburkholderia kururiensis]
MSGLARERRGGARHLISASLQWRRATVVDLCLLDRNLTGFRRTTLVPAPGGLAVH